MVKRSEVKSKSRFIGKALGEIAGATVGGAAGVASENPVVGALVAKVVGDELGEFTGDKFGVASEKVFDAVDSRVNKARSKFAPIANAIKKKVSKVKHSAEKVASVVESLGHMGKTLINPVNRAKIIKGFITGEGAVYPGSSFIGPGNPLPGEHWTKELKPRTAADYAAYWHDIEYGKYLDAGVPAKELYMGYSDADARLQERADINTEQGLAAWLGMEAKRLLMKQGLSKRIRDSSVPGLHPPVFSKDKFKEMYKTGPFTEYEAERAHLF